MTAKRCIPKPTFRCKRSPNLICNMLCWSRFCLVSVLLIYFYHVTNSLYAKIGIFLRKAVLPPPEKTGVILHPYLPKTATFLLPWIFLHWNYFNHILKTLLPVTKTILYWTLHEYKAYQIFSRHLNTEYILKLVVISADLFWHSCIRQLYVFEGELLYS